MAGFIHDQLDIKLLVLYIMDRAAAPNDFATLTDLSLCDSGVDYFQPFPHHPPAVRPAAGPLEPSAEAQGPGPGPGGGTAAGL